MIKKMFNIFYKDTNMPEAQDGAVRPSSIITQVHKHTVVAAASKIDEDDDTYEDAVTGSFWTRCCRCLLKQTDDEELMQEDPFIGPQLGHNKGKKTLVLDLDETLVHSSFEGNHQPDIFMPIQIQNQTFNVSVMIRPGVEEYLKRMGELYEVVVFTASLSEYANPLVDILDTTGVVSYRLFREHCTFYNGVYVKDLSRLGRDLKDVIIVDNSPNSFLFHTNNAVLIKNFFDDKEDRELEILTPFFEFMAGIDDVRPTETWRIKYFEGEVAEYMEAQKSKRNFIDSATKMKQPDDSSETLSGKSSKDWAETDEGSPEQPTKQIKDGSMTFPNIISSQKHSNYTMVPNKGPQTLAKPLVSVKEPLDIFSPKTEFDEKVEKSKGRKFVFPQNLRKGKESRNCVTEHADHDLEPFELEKLKQIELTNEEDVEDRKKIEGARFLNSKLNLQSPVHHKIGTHFEYPSTNELVEVLPPPVKKLTTNPLYRPVEQDSQGMTSDSLE